MGIKSIQLLLFLIIFTVVISFEIRSLTHPSNINWPWTSCGTGAYNMTEFSLDEIPFKGAKIYYYSSGKMTTKGHFGKFVTVTFLNDV